MKNIIILHGCGDNPNSFWFPWLKEQVQTKGYSVWIPQLPESDIPDLRTQLPYVINEGTFNSDKLIK